MDGRIQKQVHLPLGTAVGIAWRSLRVRMGRSVLTLLTIVMAIAFLTDIWGMRAFEPGVRGASLAAQGITDPAAEVTSWGRTVWLSGLSLLVCAVGITNAMLMSVMERFRDIGTMKCLGALDSFVLKLFLLESLFLGVVGGVAGGILGNLLAAVTLWHKYGGIVWSHLPMGEVAGIALGGAAVGLLMTAGAAYYPARRAARMPPMEAMRIDV